MKSVSCTDTVTVNKYISEVNKSNKRQQGIDGYLALRFTALLHVAICQDRLQGDYSMNQSVAARHYHCMVHDLIINSVL